MLQIRIETVIIYNNESLITKPEQLSQIVNYINIAKYIKNLYKIQRIFNPHIYQFNNRSQNLFYQ